MCLLMWEEKISEREKETIWSESYSHIVAEFQIGNSDLQSPVLQLVGWNVVFSNLSIVLSLFASSQEKRLIYVSGEWIWKEVNLIFENVSKLCTKNGTISMVRVE